MVQDDRLEETVRFNETLGNRNIIIPGLPEEMRNSKEAWKRTAEFFNDRAERLARYGMRIGYHNHAVEFQPIDGEIPWDIFFGNTREEVIMQLDTGNARHGGG
ncbi:MAG: hypothetical protein KatS3mg115_1437 [Candidatus Poribacteria bacterium]|nr:MAG: hypothetical protein KatS3mg115_1437 [Candidatus Poribacteria bacterium]